MIGSFASEGGRPAIFLPEQVEVLAHGLFSRSLQILALSRLLERGFFTLRIVAEVWVERKSIGGYFWARYESQTLHAPSPDRFRVVAGSLLKNSQAALTRTFSVSLAIAGVTNPKKTIARSNLATVSDFSR